MFKWIRRILKRNRKDKSNREEVNVVISIAKAKALYKELIIKAHPDKHPLKEELAKELTEQINHNRYNYKELIKIKERIIQKL